MIEVSAFTVHNKVSDLFMKRETREKRKERSPRLGAWWLVGLLGGIEGGIDVCSVL